MEKEKTDKEKIRTILIGLGNGTVSLKVATSLITELSDTTKPQPLVRYGYVKPLDGLTALINTQTDETIRVDFKNRGEQWAYYCKYVKVTIEVINEDEVK